MKTKSILFAALLGAALASLFVSACSTPQLEASGAYIAAEVATTSILQKHPESLPALKLLVVDWGKYQGGTLTSADEATLLQTIVTATKGNLSPAQAALLDGATQQVLANVNTTAPTPLGGAAAAIITDVVNGAGRALAIYQPPA